MYRSYFSMFSFHIRLHRIEISDTAVASFGRSPTALVNELEIWDDSDFSQAWVKPIAKVGESSAVYTDQLSPNSRQPPGMRTDSHVRFQTPQLLPVQPPIDHITIRDTFTLAHKLSLKNRGVRLARFVLFKLY
jgi:hypothetical protein